MSTLPLVLVAAVARNGVIGKAGALPWRLPGDMAHFRRVTMGRPVLMGRRTWDSIGSPLPGRFCIVVSRDRGFRAAGAATTRTLEDGVAVADRIGREHRADSIVVAGGGSLYAALIGQAGRLCITEVDLAPDGDTTFPAIDPLVWQETDRRHHETPAGHDAEYAFVSYERC